MKENVSFSVDNLIKKLKSLSNPGAIEGMARYGINPDKNLGVSIPDLRQVARETGKNHKLANELWATGIHDARILAGMIGQPDEVTEKQMEQWVGDFDSWDVCDEVCMNLFEKLPFAYNKAVEWSSRDEEFIKRAGFVLMARLAVSDKKAADEKFISFLPFIKKESTDSRNFVKKAVNWALRQIGKRNITLNKLAIKAGEEIYSIDSKSARWIASDALRELKNEKIQKRLIDREKKKGKNEFLKGNKYWYSKIKA
jgi:3-methyladenine DNA glycosylase AlkD